MFMLNFLRSLTHRIMADNISFLAGGVAFYGLLALFPAMAALVALFGLMANPIIVNDQLEAVRVLFPPNVFEIFQRQLNSLLTQPNRALSLTAIFSIVLTVYSATKGTKAMLAALNNVFRTTETRSWFYRQFQSYSLTLGAVVLMMLAVFIVIAVPVMLRLLPDELLGNLKRPIEAIRWLSLSAAIFGGLFILFLFGPNRRVHEARFRALFWGAFLATALWVATAVGGSVLIQLVPRINAAYGSVGALLGLMMWVYLSAYIVLLGGAITATAERFSSDIAYSPDEENECD